MYFLVVLTFNLENLGKVDPIKVAEKFAEKIAHAYCRNKLLRKVFQSDLDKIF